MNPLTQKDDSDDQICREERVDKIQHEMRKLGFNENQY